MRMKAEEIVASVVAVASIAVSISHLAGALERVPFLEENIPTFTLLMTGLMGSYLILERRTKLEELDSLVRQKGDDVIRAVSGVAIRRFQSSREVYAYVSERIQSAVSSVDDLTWGPVEDEQLPTVIEARDVYIRDIRRAAKRGLRYREVMSFPPGDRVKRARAMLEERLPSYSLRYYLATQEIPLLDFVVFDRKEVVICFYRSGILPGDREVRLMTTQPDLVELFQDYFDTIWHKGRVLQDNRNIDLNELSRVERQFEAAEAGGHVIALKREM